MAEEAKQNRDPNLRKPPSAGGPRRITPQGRQPRLNAAGPRQRETNAAPHGRRKKSWIKKAAPYLLPGVATGGGIAFSLTDFFPI